MDSEELKKIISALECLAQGINPYTGERAADGEILNDIRICRLLLTVTTFLRDSASSQYQNDKNIKNREAKVRFEYNEKLHAQIVIETAPITITKIAENIKQAYGDSCILTYEDIRKLLFAKGVLLENPKFGSDKGSPGPHEQKYILNPEVQIPGISCVERSDRYGRPYKAIIFHARGQKYVLDLLKEAGTIIR